MNYFYGINNNILKSEIQIPLFKNKDTKPTKINLFSVQPKNNEWKFTKLDITPVDDNFYIIKNNNIENDLAFFLAYENDPIVFDKNHLNNYNEFTNTSPAFRANLKFFLPNGGFSSFQSEYPYDMINKNGSILSSISSLINTEADKNFIVLRNIFKNPLHKEFKIYLFNVKERKVEEKYTIFTNYTNLIEIEKKYIKPEIFLVSQKYLCVPVYISQKGKYLSAEHTHPPHEYILSQNRFKKINELKNQINEIINKENS